MIEHTAEAKSPSQLNFIASINTRRIERHHRRSYRVSYSIIPYSRKIWRRIKFGDLAVYITTAKFKFANILVIVFGAQPPNLIPANISSYTVIIIMIKIQDTTIEDHTDMLYTCMYRQEYYNTLVQQLKHTGGVGVEQEKFSTIPPETIPPTHSIPSP